MPLPALYGHDALRRRLAASIPTHRLPQVILLEGPRGVGKQRLGLWLAQAILCDRPGDEGGCGSCRSCRLVSTLSHPDLHWFIPVETTKKGADADKQVELVQQALDEEVAARREQPFYQAPTGLASHGIASVRLLSRQLHLTPVLARYKVFLIGDAERLIPQRSSPEAANALLKALEEPPANTTFVLTSAEPDALLPTMLSRVVRIRVARLNDSVVTEFVQRELPADAQRNVRQLVADSDGCIGRVLATIAGTTDSDEHAVDAFLSASRRSQVDRLAIALGQPPFQARGAFTRVLDGLLDRLRSEARSGKDTAAVVAAIARVLDAREMAQGNVNPQLVAAVLADELWSGS